MDNSPRFDCAKALDAVDFNSYLAHECELLSKFALWLEKSDGSIYWNQRHKELCDKINQRLWNDQQGFYFDCHADTAEQTDIMSSAGFLPLLCGAADTAKAQKLAAHLENPKTFASAFAVPSIAANQQCYSKDMWRGPTWVNLNWMIAQGLERYGLKDAAFKIRNNTCRQIEKYYQKYGTFFEFYDDRCEVDPPELLRKGKNDPSIWVHQVIFDYGWTAGLYLDMLSSFREI
jgi:neutral trehalase